MHRFKLNRVTPFAHLKKIYALKNGAYFGGSSTVKEDDCKIICSSPYVDEKHFQLIVSDGNAYLTTVASVIEINFTSCPIPLINHTLKNGDLIGVGCPTTQDCYEDPECFIFQLIEIGSDMDTPPLTSAPKSLGERCACHHDPTIDQYRRAKHPIKCTFPKCTFTCWRIEDLNDHVGTNEEHLAARAMPNFVPAMLKVEYESFEFDIDTLP